MKLRPILAGLLLLAGVLAGCTEGGDRDTVTPTPGPWTSPDDPIPTTPEHDHADPTQHRFARNATMLAHMSLRDFGWDEDTPVGAHAVDIHGDLLAVAVNAGETDRGQQGFHLVDVSDPAHPVHVAFYDAGVPVSGDRTIAFAADGKTVFLGYEGNPRAGVAAVDVSDPTQPHEVAFWSDPANFGSHTLSTGVVAGAQYVFSLALGVNILRFDGDALVLVGKYLTADELAILDAPGSSTGPQTYALRSLYGHDMTFYDDPVTGKPLLLVAYAYDGAKILDLTVPSVPLLIARWLPPADTSHKHYTHSVAAERVDGRLIAVVGSETFEPENQEIASPIWILDATDAVAGPPLLTDPVFEATWRNPGGASAGNLGRSVHFFRLQDGLLTLAHYHGGVWRLDLRTQEARAEATTVGYIMPVPDDAVRPPEDCCIGFELGGVPMVFDVAVGADGTAYAADIIQGLTVLRFDVA